MAAKEHQRKPSDTVSELRSTTKSQESGDEHRAFGCFGPDTYQKKPLTEGWSSSIRDDSVSAISHGLCTNQFFPSGFVSWIVSR